MGYLPSGGKGQRMSMQVRGFVPPLLASRGSVSRGRLHGMGTLLEFVGAWAVALPIAVFSLKGFMSELRRTEAMHRAVLAEYELRLCGELEAARANLTSAASWLARQDAALTHDAEAAAIDLAARLASAYPGHLAAEAGVCQSPPGVPTLLGNFVVALHYQRHDGQPPDWPNWVARVVP